MRRNWLVIGGVALVLAVLVWAWVDGGREPVRDIVEPVALPGAPK